MSSLITNLPAETSSQSLEELDHLVRSTKKVKKGHLEAIDTEMECQNLSENADVDEVMETQFPEIPRSGNINVQEHLKSFKNALLNANKSAEEEMANRLEMFPESEDEEEEEEDQEMHQTKSRIKVTFPKDHLKKIRQNWRGCLIIKLLGRNMGYKILMDKIHRLWNLDGNFTPIDVGLGYYVIKFELRSDYFKVYHGGPWIIQDHYLTVQKWQGNFKADQARATKTAIWIRLSMLPLEYYEEETLKLVAKELGKVLKIDLKTEMEARGSYARICLEVDLNKPLEPSIAVDKHDIRIEYEHIHQICFACGRVGHKREFCPQSAVAQPPEAGTAAVSMTVGNAGGTEAGLGSINGNMRQAVAEESEYGEWMLVTRRRNRGYRPGPMHRIGSERIPQGKANGQGVRGKVKTGQPNTWKAKGVSGKEGTSYGPMEQATKNLREQAVGTAKPSMVQPAYPEAQTNPGNATPTGEEAQIVVEAQSVPIVTKPSGEAQATKTLVPFLQIDSISLRPFTKATDSYIASPVPTLAPLSPPAVVEAHSESSPVNFCKTPPETQPKADTKEPPDPPSEEGSLADFHGATRPSEVLNQQRRELTQAGNDEEQLRVRERENISRPRERSYSPRGNRVVDRGSKVKDQVERFQATGARAARGDNETQPARGSHTKQG